MMKYPSRRKSLAPLAAAAATLAVLAGCASYSGIAPKASLVEPTSAGVEAAAATAPGVDSAWWRGFGEPALDVLVERSLEGNPSLRVAQARLERAAAAAEGADAARMPQVNGVFE